MKRTKLLGNGLSRTAMLYDIALVANYKLTAADMNKFKQVNPRSLESVHNEIMRARNPSNALFALKFLLG